MHYNKTHRHRLSARRHKGGDSIQEIRVIQKKSNTGNVTYSIAKPPKQMNVTVVNAPKPMSVTRVNAPKPMSVRHENPPKLMSVTNVNPTYTTITPMTVTPMTVTGVNAKRMNAVKPINAIHSEVIAPTSLNAQLVNSSKDNKEENYKKYLIEEKYKKYLITEQQRNKNIKNSLINEQRTNSYTNKLKLIRSTQTPNNKGYYNVNGQKMRIGQKDGIFYALPAGRERQIPTKSPLRQERRLEKKQQLQSKTNTTNPFKISNKWDDDENNSPDQKTPTTPITINTEPLDNITKLNNVINKFNGSKDNATHGIFFVSDTNKDALDKKIVEIESTLRKDARKQILYYCYIIQTKSVIKQLGFSNDVGYRLCVFIKNDNGSEPLSSYIFKLRENNDEFTVKSAKDDEKKALREELKKYSTNINLIFNALHQTNITNSFSEKIISNMMDDVKKNGEYKIDELLNELKRLSKSYIEDAQLITSTIHMSGGRYTIRHKHQRMYKKQKHTRKH